MDASARNLASGAQQKPTAVLSRAVPWVFVAATGAALFFWNGLASLGAAWARPEYSYGPLVPFITTYLTLREIHRQPVKSDRGPRVFGLVVFVIAIGVGLIGNLARIPDIITYGFILAIGAFVLLLAGTREGWRFWPGWLHLIFMLPLPQFIYLTVSTKLQLLSSALGVSFIQMANIPVYLDGNIIDLGNYKLQVAEACSGLRYLFPLFSFGWLMSVLYNGPNWHRVVIFLSTIPITILMNSFRIGMIGVLVNQFGISQAEGFLHFFEGWVIFLTCTIILYFEAWILWRFFSFGFPRTTHVLRLDYQGIHQPLARFLDAASNGALIGAALTMLAAGLAWQLLPSSAAPHVDRASFATFPLQIDHWQGSALVLDPDTARVLAADDYLLANYNANGQEVGLLMSFYKSQTEGSGIHSPEICLPGGGWEVSQWEQVPITIQQGGTTQIYHVNRAVIQKGLDRQLVYYWFEEQGRRATNDYEAKFLSVWNTITQGRSDGGLVRLTTPIDPSRGIVDASARLASFLEKIAPILPDYFPDRGATAPSQPNS
ncbi:VPLPA-CTERM-specific exosortase XrtD [Mesorhizobium koreense]|uniref:VPLPA-CTERM-specific exosortase XrtD n=1 Tax=Mesorhizobium koreense TaxID=3074855 RepID=UPI00287B795F|nr:VPLPA-CTERM-specific exosortase XrtD [Mesorhizobium sp. WR6]